MCLGTNCPQKEKCYRFICNPEPLYQSYFLEIPGKFVQKYSDKQTDNPFETIHVWECEMFWGEKNTEVMSILNDIFNLT